MKGEGRRGKEEEGGGSRRKEEEGGGRRGKEEEGGGSRRKEGDGWGGGVRKGKEVKGEKRAYLWFNKLSIHIDNADSLINHSHRITLP